ncbi:uncharacterized mitochondrial protein AtMg00810-like [Ziziphus jujuba]|uniref:Uncharacterized mitochondrial protein AtMg00810-like n=1 Tax=Ziziphus jujuba TaxID=326968 RepID=A0ABM3ZUJ3_ZIZJJ|nr:uncharacterized mitochondrial protein AtMg00810-like [Ziziphus jujuba]
MTYELKMIKKNKTGELVNRPTDKLVIGVKWVYKTKLNLDGSIQKNKARNDDEMLHWFKEDMMKRYEMTDLGLLHHFLGMGVIQIGLSIFVHQNKYASTLLNKFGLTNCNPFLTPLIANEKLSKEDGSGAADEEFYRRIVGSLMYLTATRLDIMFAANLLARFMHCPTKKHLGIAKRVLRYVKGTLDYGLQ